MVTKRVTVIPSATQLNKGAKAISEMKDLLPMHLSAKDKRILAKAIYEAMVGQPHKDERQTELCNPNSTQPSSSAEQ